MAATRLATKILSLDGSSRIYESTTAESLQQLNFPSNALVPATSKMSLDRSSVPLRSSLRTVSDFKGATLDFEQRNWDRPLQTM